MSLAKKHVGGFSPNGGHLYALFDEQGILRIWDTEANTLIQEFTPNLHLCGSCTALTWFRVATPTPRAKKSRKSQTISSYDKLYLALGTVKGNVVVYSLKEGEIERTLSGDNHDGPITSIVYDQVWGHLYTVGVDCRALVWSLEEERCIGQWQVGPEKPQNIVYLSESRTLAVGGRQLKIYDVVSKEMVETFTGHSGEINAMTSVAIGEQEYVLTTARMERVICFWKVDKKGSNKASVCTLLMEDLAYCLASEVCDGGNLRVASVTRNGNIHIYLLNINGLSSEKPIKPRVSLQIASGSSKTLEPLYAVAAHFYYDSNHSQEILFGYGSRSLLQFERFTPNYNEKLNVITRADPKKLYARKQQTEKPGTPAALKIKEPINSTKAVEYNSALPISKKKVQNEVSMEARLQHLQIHATTQLSGGKLQTHSKTQLLMQALQSKDQKMIQAVLSTQDLEIIQLTLARLPLDFVSPLVTELSQLLQGKHVNVTCALRWLRILACTHTSVLMSEDKEALREKLGICLGVAEQRMHCLTEALQITGRVNLIINQMKRNADNHLNENNVLIVEEDEDEATESQRDENNWSDLEDELIEANNLVEDEVPADNDLAADDEDVEMTQNSDDEDDDDDDSADTDN